MSEVSEALDGLISDLAESAYATSEAQHADIWPQMVDLGLHAVGIDEQDGGSGGTVGDAIDAAYALGKHAISSPFIEHSTALACLAEAGHAGVADDSQGTLVTIAGSAGDVVEGADGSISGRAVQVPWASRATHMILLAPGVGGRLVELASSGVRVETRRNAAGEPRDTVHLDRAQSVAELPEGCRELVSNRLGALRSASLAGAVAGAYATTRSYVNQREQFGAPLVKIPAVAANLATIKAELIQAQAALERVRHTVESGLSGPGTTVAVASARVITARAATVAARVGHQLHGAMGITLEYPLHRHTTRLWAWRDDERAQGEWAELLAKLADGLGEPALWDLIAP